MTETVAVAEAAKASKKIKVKKAGVSKKAPASHPPTAQMVNGAIKALKERGGSSLQAIKKYVSLTYKVDAEKLAPFIKKYLVSAVAKGKLVRTKGKGAAGSFKLASAVKAEKPKKVVKKSTKPKKVKKTGEKVSKPKAKPKKPSKAKKATAAPTKKPKSPKPKKAVKKKAAK